MPPTDESPIDEPEPDLAGLDDVRKCTIRLYQCVDRYGDMIEGEQKKKIKHGGGNFPYGGRGWITLTCYNNDGEGHNREETIERGLEWCVVWYMEHPGGRYESHPGKSPHFDERKDVGDAGNIAVGFSSWADALSYNFVFRPTEDLHGKKIKIHAIVTDRKGNSLTSNTFEVGVS